MTSSAETSDRGYVVIWVWLVVLLGAGMLVFSLPIPA